jgi:hypothetical protein
MHRHINGKGRYIIGVEQADADALAGLLSLLPSQGAEQGGGRDDARKAFEAKYREMAGPYSTGAPDFRLSETGDAYATAWVQANFAWFWRGWRALTPSPESPAGWRAGWKVDVEYAQEMAREAYEEALRLGMERGADICISQDLVDDCWHRSTIAAELRSRLSAAPEPSREQDMGEGNQGLSSDVQLTGHRPRVPR